MIQRIVRKVLWGLFFFAFFEKFFVPILTSGGLAAVSSSFFAALYSAFGRYDVVHIHAEGPAFFCWLPKLFGKRVVITVHGLDWAREKWKSGFGSKIIRQGEKNAVKYADEIIVLSKGVQKYFLETYGKIILLTSRNMNSYNGNIGMINKNTARILLAWLDKWDIPYDEIIYGKPWPGHKGFYVDDRTVRPDEFLNCSVEEMDSICRKSRDQSK